MSKYYEPSGQYSVLSFLYFLIACIFLLPILAAVYAYCIWYIPFPYINFFITGAFGFAAGWIVSFLAIKLGKVRSSNLAMLLGFLGGLVALYLHWAIWIDLVINAGESYGSDRIGVTVSNIKIVQVLNLVLQPGVLFSIIGELKEFGTWGLMGTAVSGWPLMIIWIIEAGMIFFFALSKPMGQASQPFCEINQKWFNEKVLTPFEYLKNYGEVVRELESGNNSVFADLAKLPNSKESSHSLFTLYSNDTNENYLSIENKDATVNDKGEVDFEDTMVVNYISIDEELSQQLEHA